jgi:hypothetical protein
MIIAIRRFFALRAARRAQRDYDLYQTQPAGAGWHVSIATAYQMKARRLSARAARFI